MKHITKMIKQDMKRLISGIIFFYFVFCSFTAVAEKSTSEGSYKIQLSVSNLKDTPVYLAFYYNGKTYSKDTTLLNSKGVGTFSKKEKLPEGVYIIYFDSNKFFDVLIGADQNIKIKTDTSDLSKVSVNGALESVKFQELIDFMSNKHKEQAELRKKYIDKSIDSLSYVQLSKKLNDDVESFQNRLIAENKGTFFSAFLKGTIPVETPAFEEIADSLRPMARYQYAKKHYFDNINLSDPRFLRTPYFPTKVDNYMSKYIIQIPDTLVEAAVDLIEKSKGDKETYQTMTSKMMNYGLKSQIMGMDAMWLALADRYYFSGQATWADSAWVEDLRKEAKKIRYNLIGLPAHNLMVRDSNDKVVQLRDLTQEIVLVYFFEPSCGHCKKMTPELHNTIYKKYKDKGFEVFACYTQTDKKEWQEFLNKHDLKDWINVWDPYRESYFWEFYDASSTPGLYLLNKGRKIIAKKIDLNTLDKILEEELINRKNKPQEK